jgi:hypothetical protein
MVWVVNFILCPVHTEWEASEPVWTIGRTENTDIRIKDRQLQLHLDYILLKSLLHVSAYDQGIVSRG